MIKQMPLAITFAQLENTPVGPISFVAGERGLQGVAFTDLPAYKQAWQQLDTAPSLVGLQTLGSLLVEVNAYLDGIQKAFTVPIAWDCLKGFQLQVLRVAAEIPYGQVRTYGEVARMLGKAGAARAVGMALGSNPMPLVIPCHRVVGSDLGLRGFIAGTEIKAFLLTLEGHKVVGQRIVRGSDLGDI